MSGWERGGLITEIFRFVSQFLRKIHRQERVVEEVKLVLKPHYTKKHISKDDYKDILRRAVPKVSPSHLNHVRSIDFIPTLRLLSLATDLPQSYR